MKTKEMTKIALCTAILTVCSWISIPTQPVPFTLQVFAIFFISMLLSPRDSFFTVLLWMLLGIVGLPVFAKFNRGLGALFGPTGGFILSFLITAPLSSWLNARFSKLSWIIMPPILLGIIYSLGALWLVLQTSMPLSKALTVAVLPFIPFDVLKIYLAKSLYSLTYRRLR